VIDTAGVRKKSSIANDIEYYSFVRATKSVASSDVILFLIDSTEPLSQVDKKLGAFIADEFKACILVVNKWDLAKNQASTDDYVKYLGKMLPQMTYAPIAFTTASEGKNVQSVIDLAQELFKQATTKVSTANLNKAIEAITEERMGGKSKGGSLPKIYYGTQVAINPITLIVFVNKMELFDENFKRYLINKLRDHLGFAEVPIRLLIRPRRREKL
jgi:GTP-binding protein